MAMNHGPDAPAAPGRMPAGRLGGRRIVITGAASGIGRRTVQLFASEGAALLLLDRDGERLAAVAAETGGHAAALDITDEQAVAAGIAEGAAALGGIDGLVNAAGIMMRGLVGEVAAAEWRRILEVNLTGTYIVVRGCLPWLMRQAGATIVNIGSAQGLLPNAPGFSAYAASKGGVVNLSRALAAELAPAVRVNCVCPGMVDTPMADGYRANVGNYALKRLADPVEIARAILFLTSGESSYVTGATLAADGGRSFH
jgi:NAD(P)-dependent dehydrogenase (short-subunit alcohol dehydrogenase family)